MLYFGRNCVKRDIMKRSGCKTEEKLIELNILLTIRLLKWEGGIWIQKVMFANKRWQHCAFKNRETSALAYLKVPYLKIPNLKIKTVAIYL